MPETAPPGKIEFRLTLQHCLRILNVNEIIARDIFKQNRGPIKTYI